MHRERLLLVLEAARRLGFLGPGPVQAHLDHALGFAAAIEAGWPADTELRSAVDLGSGGGVPGLPLAIAFAGSTWLLVDSAHRRAAFLRSAIAELDLTNRVAIAELRAEELGRLDEHRGHYQLAVARGFGPPAVTAECAAPLLAAPGMAVVSEPPPTTESRWPADGLGMVGMEPGPTVRAAGASFQVLVQRSPCPSRYPRRVGVPAKRPLF